MRKNLLLLSAISIVLILTAILSGIYFTSSPVPTSAGPEPVVIDPIADLYSFGDTDRYAVLLDLAEAQVRPQSKLILTAAASGAISPDEGICTHTGVSVTTPPPGVVQHSIAQNGQSSSIWHQAVNWLATPFEDHYMVTLWVPDNQHSSFKLVSGDAPTSPAVCAEQVDEDV
jgi:hypothetical protein